MDLGLHGKVVVITGGSRGIGRAIATVCAMEGADIALCARTQETIDGTLTDLQAYGTHVFGQKADVTQQAKLEQFLRMSAEALGGIDILINNVGGSQGKGCLDQRMKNGLERLISTCFIPCGPLVPSSRICNSAGTVPS